MAQIDTTKYAAQVSNASSGTVISSTTFKNFIADVKDVVDKNSPEGTYAADAGASDTYAITLSPVPTAYFTGMTVRFKANTANTGAATLNVNSLGAKTIVKNKDITLEDSDIKSGQLVTVVYDGTNFQLQTPSSLLNTNDSISRQSIINGNFDIWKETSLTNPATNSYTANRWRVQVGAGGGALPNVVVSRQQLTLGDLLGSFYFHRINVDGSGTTLGASSFYILLQRMEHVTRFLCGSGKKLTLSFYAKSSISNKRLGADLSLTYGTGGSPSSSENIVGTNFTITSSWQKFSYTFTTNTLVGKTFGTNDNDYVSLNFWPMWGSDFNSRVGSSSAETFVGSGNIDIAQVQVCSGDVAIPFQPRSQSEENMLCDRFIKVFSDSSNTEIPIGSGTAISTTQARIIVNLGTPMRSAPTLTATAGDWKISDGVTSTDVTGISIVTDQKSSRTVTLLITVSAGLTQYRPYYLIADTTASRIMVFDAEL